MSIPIKSFIVAGAIILSGLSAGLFFSWSISVIPGTQKVSDLAYLETMQSINRAILNPMFFFVFFGSIILLGISSAMAYQTGRLTFALLLVSTVSYLIGTIGVTGLGNVPLNDELETLQILETSLDQRAEFRQYYESKWNQLHFIRTVFALVSFLLAVTALITQNIKS